MRALPIIMVIAAVGLSACGEPDSRELVVPDSLLVVVLADLHLADARGRLPNPPPGLRDSVLVFHGLSGETFQAAMDGFIEYPAELTNMYNSVLDRLNAARSAEAPSS